LALLCSLASALTIAQEKFLIEGIFDAELHRTDAHSRLLSRNDGDLSILGRLQLWAALQVSPGVQIYALAEIETDDSSGERETEAEIEQFALRYTSRSSPYFFFEAGRILSPLGAYSNRHLSTQNPLIGQPHIYITTYPLGIQAAGSSGWLDYRAALVDQPDIKPDFIPADPESAFRPALGFGVTPFPELRFGFSYTEGPYLNRQLNPGLPAGTGWRDFDQQVLGFDFQFSRGYLEFNGQLVVSRYDVPFHSYSTDDKSYYLELKYTWTPRLYGALRYGNNKGTAIEHMGDSSWLGQNIEFRDLEVGLGYRFSPDTLFKVAYRSDHWDTPVSRENPVENGHSLSLQLSHHFDPGSWLVKKP
jgi:hypothetical protein